MFDRDGLWECHQPYLRVSASPSNEFATAKDGSNNVAADANDKIVCVTAVLPRLCFVNLISLRPDFLLDDDDGGRSNNASCPPSPLSSTPSPGVRTISPVIERVEFCKTEADGVFVEVPEVTSSESHIRHFFRTGYPSRLTVAARGLARCVRVTVRMGTLSSASASRPPSILELCFDVEPAGILSACFECYPVDECPPPVAQMRLMNAVTCVASRADVYERASSLALCGLAMARSRRFVQGAEMIEAAARTIEERETVTGPAFGANFAGERSWDEHFVAPLDDDYAVPYRVGIDGYSVQTEVSAAAILHILAADVHLQASNSARFIRSVRTACESIHSLPRPPSRDPVSDAGTCLAPVADAFLAVARRCLGDTAIVVRGAILRIIVSASESLGSNIGRLFPLLVRDVAFSYSHHLCTHHVPLADAIAGRSRATSTSSVGSNPMLASQKETMQAITDALSHSSTGGGGLNVQLSSAYESALECFHSLSTRYGGFVLAGRLDGGAARTRRTSGRASDCEGMGRDDIDNRLDIRSSLFEALSPTTSSEFHPSALVHLLRMDAEMAARSGAWCADTAYLTILLQLHDAAASRGDSESVLATTRTWREFVRQPCPPRAAGSLMRWASAVLSRWPCVPWGSARDAEIADSPALRRMSTRSHVVYHCNCGESNGASLPHGCLVLVLDLVRAVGSTYGHLCVPPCAGGGGVCAVSERGKRALESTRAGLCAVLFAIELCARAHLRLMASDPRKVALDMFGKLWSCVRLDPQLSSALLAEMLDAACVMTDAGRSLPLHAAHSLRVGVDSFLPSRDGKPVIPGFVEGASTSLATACEKGCGVGSVGGGETCPSFRQLLTSMMSFVTRASDWLPGCTHDDAPALVAALVRCLLASGRLSDAACFAALEAMFHKHAVRTIAHRAALEDLAKAFALQSSYASSSRASSRSTDAGDKGINSPCSQESGVHTLVLILRHCVIDSTLPPAIYDGGAFERDPPRVEREHDLFVDRLTFASDCLVETDHLAPVADRDDGLRVLHTVASLLVEVVERHPQSRVRELALRTAMLCVLKCVRPTTATQATSASVCGSHSPSQCTHAPLPSNPVEHLLTKLSPPDATYSDEGEEPSCESYSMADIFVATIRSALTHRVHGDLQRRCLVTLSGVFEAGGHLSLAHVPFEFWAWMVAAIVPLIGLVACNDWAEVRNPALSLLVSLSSDLCEGTHLRPPRLHLAAGAVSAFCAPTGPGAGAPSVLSSLLHGESLQSRVAGVRIAGNLLGAERHVRRHFAGHPFADPAHWMAIVEDLIDIEECDPVLAETVAPLIDVAQSLFPSPDAPPPVTPTPDVPDVPDIASGPEGAAATISMEAFSLPLSDDTWALIVACNMSSLRTAEAGSSARDSFAVSPSARLAAMKGRLTQPGGGGGMGGSGGGLGPAHSQALHTRDAQRSRRQAPRSPIGTSSADRILEDEEDSEGGERDRRGDVHGRGNVACKGSSDYDDGIDGEDGEPEVDLLSGSAPPVLEDHRGLAQHGQSRSKGAGIREDAALDFGNEFSLEDADADADADAGMDVGAAGERGARVDKLLSGGGLTAFSANSANNGKQNRPATAAKGSQRKGEKKASEKRKVGLSDSDSDEDEDVEYLYIAGQLDVLEERLGDGTNSPSGASGTARTHAPMTRADVIEGSSNGGSGTAGSSKRPQRPQSASASRAGRAPTGAVAAWAVAGVAGDLGEGAPLSPSSPGSMRRGSGRGVPFTRGGAVSPDVRESRDGGMSKPSANGFFDAYAMFEDETVGDDDDDIAGNVTLSDAQISLALDDFRDEFGANGVDDTTDA